MGELLPLKSTGTRGRSGGVCVASTGAVVYRARTVAVHSNGLLTKTRRPLKPPLQINLGLQKKSFVSCNMPKNVRVGKSASFFFFSFYILFLPRRFCGQNRRKIRFAKKVVNNCENSVFRVIFVKK